MLGQHPAKRRRHRNVTLRRPRLRLDQRPAPTIQLRTDTDHALANVDVLPAQRQALTLPKAEQNTEDDGGGAVGDRLDDGLRQGEGEVAHRAIAAAHEWSLSVPAVGLRV